MVNIHMKRCSMSLIIREMQIKTTMRDHLIPVRKAIINKSTNNKCWWGCRKRETLLYYWWECRSVQPLWRTVWRYFQELKMELPYDPEIPLLGIYLKKPEILIWKNISTPCSFLFTVTKCSFIYNDKDWKQPKCSSADECVKTTMGHLHNEILLSH